MNKSRVYLSSALIASACVLLAIAGSITAQTMPLSGEEAHRRAQALLKL